MIKKQAFTLAEVLITLTIVGVIAALTIPNLMQKYTEQATVKKVQKFYSTLSNAYNLASKENGSAYEWGLTGENTESSIIVYERLFKPYFKIVKDCGIKNTGNCITNDRYKYYNDTLASSYAGGAYYKVTLADGASVFFAPHITGSTLYIFIYYDINGPKAPNQFGKDLFEFDFVNGGVVPAGIQKGKYASRPFEAACTNKTQSGSGCAAWIIYKGNMDYLHCDGLDWNKNSCKDK